LGASVAAVGVHHHPLSEGSYSVGLDTHRMGGEVKSLSGGVGLSCL
jgi:hypothetical protein